MSQFRQALLSLALLAGFVFLAGLPAGWAQSAPRPETAQKSGEIPLSTADYSHFPRLAWGKDGRLGVLYYRGYNHGSGNDGGISTLQRLQGPGRLRLTIDGSYAVGGRAELPAPAQIMISGEKDESARTFVIVGEDQNGRRIEETIRGPASKRTYSRQHYKRVIDIVADGPTIGRVKVGPRVVPSNMEFRYSDDDGNSWSAAITVADGILERNAFNYVGALAGLSDGTFVAIFVRINTDDGRVESVQRMSTDNGVTWSPAVPIRYSGASPTTTFRVWGQIQVTPSGQLVAMAYAGQDNWGLVSTDRGRTWQAHLIVRTPPETDYNEMAVAIISDTDWIAIARGATRREGGSSMRQFVTRDRGLTWKDLGSTNAEWSGGYVSPAMQTVQCGRELIVVWAYMARGSRSTPPPTPNSLIVRYAAADAALSSARVWSPQQIVGQAGSFTHRSGYPSIALANDCSHGVMVAGRETSETTAVIVAMKWILQPAVRPGIEGR
jgi:hypothetical protein